MNLPDLARARQVWLTRPRLIAGGVLTTAVGATAALMCVGNDSGQLLTDWVLVLQGAILFFYGVPAAVNDFVDEHRNNTWDMLKLTPLTASEVVLGRLAASTSYAVFLALCLAPWAFFALGLPKAPSTAMLLAQWTALGLAFVASAATGLSAAALAARIQNGKVGNSGLALGAVGSVVSAWTIALFTGHDTVRLVFGAVPTSLWMMAFLALWAGWAATSAVQLIGRLLSEKPRPWVFPAFLATVWAYVSLLTPGGSNRAAELISTAASVTVPAVLTLLSSFAEGEGPEEWRTNLRVAERREDWTALRPGWADAWLTVAGLALLTAVVRPESARMGLMTACFLFRDLSIFAVMRTSFRRGVEVAAMALLGAVYLLPAFYAVAMEGTGSLHWWIPMHSQTLGFAANVFPALAQAVLAGLLLRLSVRRVTRQDALKAPERAGALLG